MSENWCCSLFAGLTALTVEADDRHRNASERENVRETLLNVYHKPELVAYVGMNADWQVWVYRLVKEFDGVD